MGTVEALTGVYHADGTIRGELRYVVGRLAGRAHCALCDITHGGIREKREWRAACEALPVPFDTVHLDERPPELVAVTDGATPAVVARVDGVLEVLLGPDELDACAGDPDALLAAIDSAMAGRGLRYASGPTPAR